RSPDMIISLLKRFPRMPACAIMLMMFLPLALQAQQEVLDRIVAVVGKEPVLLSDLNDQTEFYALNNRIDLKTPGLREQVLDAMINQKLILARALEDTNITVREEEVTSQLEAVIAQRIQQFGSEKKLEQTY